MTIFRGPQLPHVPDDLLIPQYMFAETLGRPKRDSNIPFFIEDATGRKVYREEVIRRTTSLAQSLRSNWNIGRDDVVCIFSSNHIDYAPVLWATQFLGGIVTPASPGYTSAELAYQMSATKTKVLVTHSVCLPVALAASRLAGLPGSSIILLDASGPPEHATIDRLVSSSSGLEATFQGLKLMPGEARKKVAFLCFSSGTTGKPKAVVLTHYGLIANIVQMADHARVTDPKCTNKGLAPGDVAIAVSPFFHIFGLFILLHLLMYSAMTIVIVPKFDIRLYLRSIVRYNVTHLYVVPPQVVLLCKHPEVNKFNLSKVKFCMSGAAPLSGELVGHVSKVLPNSRVGQGYGLTETISVSSVDPDVKIAKVGSSGMLLPGVEAKIVKPNGALGGDGERGELLLRSPCQTPGYLDNDEANTAAFADGWFKTGDECMLKDGELYVLDRMKEILKVKGFQVAPAELEGHILLLEEVSDACVVGIPDDYSGELPLAFIVPAPSVLKELNGDKAMVRQLKERVARHVSEAKIQYKWLTGGVEIVDAIPRTTSGKLLRRVLRDRARSIAAARPVKALL